MREKKKNEIVFTLIFCPIISFSERFPMLPMLSGVRRYFWSETSWLFQHDICQRKSWAVETSLILCMSCGSTSLVSFKA